MKAAHKSLAFTVVAAFFSGLFFSAAVIAFERGEWMAGLGFMAAVCVTGVWPLLSCLLRPRKNEVS